MANREFLQVLVSAPARIRALPKTRKSISAKGGLMEEIRYKKHHILSET